jgi:glycosyltransferase involved in cell wall biosynthesis
MDIGLAKSLRHMRVVLVGPTSPHRGGIVHYTHSLANALSNQGIHVELLTYVRLFPRMLSHDPDPSKEPLPLTSDVRVHRILHWGNPRSWRAAAEVGRGAEILHLQSWTGFLAPSMGAVAEYLRKGGTRVIVTLHNIRPHEKLHRALMPLTRRLAKRADQVIVHSPTLAQLAQARLAIPKTMLTVIPHGRYDFDRNRFDQMNARLQLRLPGDKILLLCFGTIRDYKGIDTALEVLALLPPKIHLVIAGEPWVSWEHYDQLIERLGIRDRVHLDLRYIPDEETEIYYRAADVCLLPYKDFEGQSGQALTAAAFGLPIVASRVGGLQDLILDQFLVRSKDTDGFRKAILDALEMKQTTLRPGASPSWNEVAKTTATFYRRLIA